VSGYLTRPAGDPATPVDLSRVPDADLEREIKRRAEMRRRQAVTRKPPRRIATGEELRHEAERFRRAKAARGR